MTQRKLGDVILDVGGKTVSTAAEARDALVAARNDNKNSVLVRVRSGGSLRYVAMPLGRG